MMERQITFSAGLHAWRRVDCVTEETVARHLVPDHSSNTRTWHQHSEMWIRNNEYYLDNTARQRFLNINLVN